jgi:hypothetical protein
MSRKNRPRPPDPLPPITDNEDEVKSDRPLSAHPDTMDRAVQDDTELARNVEETEKKPRKGRAKTIPRATGLQNPTRHPLTPDAVNSNRVHGGGKARGGGKRIRVL